MITQRKKRSNAFIKSKNESCSDQFESKFKASYEQRMKNRRRSETVLNSFNDDRSGYLDLQQHHHSEQVEPQRPSVRRAAVVSTLTDSDLSHLSDKIAHLQRNQPLEFSSELKRPKRSWKLNFKSKDKTKEREQKLEELLATWKWNTFDPEVEKVVHMLNSCDVNHNVISGSNSSPITSKLQSTKQRKRDNAVWELFASERTYLVDHLLVLQKVFMQPLQELQCEGYLLSVDVRTVFGNLEELCKVTLDFCQTLLKVVEQDHPNQFGYAAVIDQAFETFESTVCPPYQRYFSGYNNSLNDREKLKKNDDFLLFLKNCERNQKCQRLTLNDFLVAPMQHLTKYPLLLRNIAQYTDDKHQTDSIKSTQIAVQEALKTLEGKVSWTHHYQFLQDLQASILWPPVSEVDTKTVLPESLRYALAQQPCKNLIANPKRQLVLDGFLTVIETAKTFEVYAFLFDDMLLLTTKSKKSQRRPSEVPPSLKRLEGLKDGTLFSVYRQPIALDRFLMFDIDEEKASTMGMKKSFVIIQENRFQQMCGITMLQAKTEETKRLWLKKLASTASQWMNENVIVNHRRAVLNNTSFQTDQIERNSENIPESGYSTTSEKLNKIDEAVTDSHQTNGLCKRTSTALSLKSNDSDCERSDFL